MMQNKDGSRKDKCRSLLWSGTHVLPPFSRVNAGLINSHMKAGLEHAKLDSRLLDFCRIKVGV